jgi:hypothetical protein
LNNIVIVWGMGLSRLSYVKHLISDVCTITSEKHYTWKSGKEFEGLSRFYDKKEKIIRNKIKNCDTSQFVLFEIELNSSNTLVLHRNSVLRVNAEVFKLKHRLRSLYKQQDFIHTSDDSSEAEHQKMIVQKYCDEKNVNSTHGELKKIICEKLEGEYYVILRNDISLDSDIENESGDIDILCEDVEVITKRLNLVPDKKYKSRYFLNYFGLKVQFDIRDINSGYYNKAWSERILNDKVARNGYYIPSPEDHIYSFLYHIFLHKRLIREDHVMYLNMLCEEYKIDFKEPFQNLLNYLEINNFNVEFPLDRSVPMNVNLLRDNNLAAKIPLFYKLSILKFNLRQKLKSLFYEFF